jgi:exodeoxyribonuclease VII large subunit
VVCAVGHETDITLADFVADRRCKTPTAGAAFLAEGWLQAMQALVDLGVRLKAAAEDQLLSMREHLASIGGQLPRVQATRATAFRHRLESARLALRGQRPDRRLARARQRLNENELRFDHAWQAQARRQRMAWSGLAQRLTAANPQAGITSWTQRLQGLRARLEAGSPMALLGRGYALVERAEGGGYLRAAHEVEEGDRVRITLAEGRLEAQVTAREHGKSPAGDDSDLRECRDGSA